MKPGDLSILLFGLWAFGPETFHSIWHPPGPGGQGGPFGTVPNCKTIAKIGSCEMRAGGFQKNWGEREIPGVRVKGNGSPGLVKQNTCQFGNSTARALGSIRAPDSAFSVRFRALGRD